jgi:hypothetical protein
MMRTCIHKIFFVILIISLVGSLPTQAESKTITKLTNAGRRTLNWFRPGHRKDQDNNVEVSRKAVERYPLPATGSVVVSNEFGQIRVRTWNESVVELAADIIVQAATEKMAEDISESIQLNVEAQGESLDLRTLLPDSGAQEGLLSVAVNYVLTIPSGAALTVQNSFGDTFIEGVGGKLQVNADYGSLELRRITGPISVQAHGDFPLVADDLAQGGTFQLHGTQASFQHIAGHLEIRGFRSILSLSNLATGLSLDIENDSGPIQVVLPAGATPSLLARVRHGKVISDLPLKRFNQGNLTTARLPGPKASEILLSTSFGDITIEATAPADGETQTVVAENTAPAADDGTHPFNDVITREAQATDANMLHIKAMVGNIQVKGIDEEVIRVTATRWVHMPAAALAPTALESMTCKLVRDKQRWVLQTEVVNDMAALQCSDYRVDLQIECPRTLAMKIEADQGKTDIRGTGGVIRVAQRTGSIHAEHNKGELNLNNQDGELRVVNCSGPVIAHNQNGTLSLKQVYTTIEAHNINGRTVIESPQSTQVKVRNQEGDVHILALENVLGDYDILAKKANISALFAPEVDATLVLTAKGGKVLNNTEIELDGKITRNSQEFRGRINDGLHHIRLEAKEGDISID